jgi:hypothetical protein
MLPETPLESPKTGPRHSGYHPAGLGIFGAMTIHSIRAEGNQALSGPKGLLIYPTEYIVIGANRDGPMNEVIEASELLVGCRSSAPARRRTAPDEAMN